MASLEGLLEGGGGTRDTLSDLSSSFTSGRLSNMQDANFSKHYDLQDTTLPKHHDLQDATLPKHHDLQDTNLPEHYLQCHSPLSSTAEDTVSAAGRPSRRGRKKLPNGAPEVRTKSPASRSPHDWQLENDLLSHSMHSSVSGSANSELSTIPKVTQAQALSPSPSPSSPLPSFPDSVDNQMGTSRSHPQTSVYQSRIPRLDPAYLHLKRPPSDHTHLHAPPPDHAHLGSARLSRQSPAGKYNHAIISLSTCYHGTKSVQLMFQIRGKCSLF